MSRIERNGSVSKDSRYDLLIYDFPEGYPSGALNLGFGKTPKRITGVEKVCQVFVKTLMTYSGSDVLHNTRGTTFPSCLGSYNIQSTRASDLDSEITRAISSAETQAKSILNGPAESLTNQLDSVSVIDVSHDGDSTSIRVMLVTKAGESAPIALPFTSLGIQVNE